MSIRKPHRHVPEILESIPDGVLLVDTDGIIRFANQSALEMFGYEREELLGHPVEILVPDHLRGAHLAQRQRYAQAPRSRPMGADLNLHAVRRDGSTLPVDISLSPHHGDDEFCVICTVRDASRHRQIELTLRRQQMHFELLHLATRVANDADSADEAIQTVIDQICDFLGFDVGHAYVSTFADESRSYSIKRSWFLSDPARFIPFREASEQIFFQAGIGLPGQVMETANPQWVEDVLQRSDYLRQSVARQAGLRTGIFVPLLVRRQVAAVMEFYSSGVLSRDDELLDILTQIGTILGRTIERKQARERYQREAHFNRQILEAAGDGILIVDRGGEIKFANQRALAFFEHSSSDLIGAHIGDVPRWTVEKSFEDFPTAGHPLHHVLDSGEPHFDVEMRVFRPRSGAIDLSFNLAPIQSSEGEIESIVLSVRDVTDRKRAEQLLEDQRRVLERVVEGESLNAVGRALADMIKRQLPIAAVALYAHCNDGNDLELLAASGFSEDMEQFLSRASLEHNELPCISAIRSGRPAIHHYREHSIPTEIIEFLHQSGITTCWSFPVNSSDGQSVGVFCMYLTTEIEPSDKDGRIIDTAIGQAQLAFDRIRAERQLAKQALYDPLTDLANRSLLTDRIEQALRRSRRTDEDIALLFLDLDQFKSINDGLGHHAGDELLVAAADRFRQAVRAEDTIARFAGDEFVILMERLRSRQDAIDVAERISEACRTPAVIADLEIQITCSIGIAFNERGTGSSDELLRHADQAMYRAKSRGRGEIAVFAETTDSSRLPPVLLETRLRQAIEQQSFHLVFQPIMSLPDNGIFALEALLRWHDQDLGNVPPALFLPVARRLRMTNSITRFVLQEACRQVAAFNRDHGTDISAAVNVSPEDLEDPGLLHDIQQALKNSDLSPDKLIIEITEEAIVREVEAARETLRQLRSLEIDVAIDDFGTGYSALTYLNVFPISSIKLDRSFIAGREASEEVASVIQGIIQLSHSIGISVVAEGVETPSDEEFVRAIGCNLAQGFYYAVPQGVDSVESLLNRYR